MNNIQLNKKVHQRLRVAGAALFGMLIGFSTVASALASDVVTLRVGDKALDRSFTGASAGSN
jgi:sulfonate transport system substrate-binding protein